MATILIIEDEENLRFSIKRALEKAGHDAHEADSIPEAVALIQRHSFDALLTDINLGGETGINLIRRLHDDGFDGAIIVMTAYGSIESAVEAMKLGADEYLQKPLRLDELVLTVDRLLTNRVQLRRLKLYDRLAHVAEPDNAIIGASPAWLEAISLAERLAQLPLPAKSRPSNSTTASAIPSVLLLGPTGSGKGLLARRIHDASPDTTDTSPFVHVNCAVLPPTLVESELFGHEKGAFTDAHTTREGFFEMADGGTIFLDEIGDMPLALQAKILTVVEEGTFRRVGGAKNRFVRARLIAATNQNLAQEVNAGNFRKDLFYRLNPFTIELPPLCERGDDAILIAEQMLGQFASQFRRDDLSFTADARDAIRRHTWPGNVRELINAVQRAAMLSKSQAVSAKDLGLQTDQSRPAPPTDQPLSQPTRNGAMPLVFDFHNRSYTAENVEKELMIQALEHARKRLKGRTPRWNAAQQLPIPHRALRPRAARPGDRRQMTPRLHRTLVTALIPLAGAGSAHAKTHKVWADDPDDAVLRLTDPNGTINPNSTLPDVTTVVMSGWLPDSPFLDPFTGSFINTRDAHIFRLDIIFSGLVNPPGPIVPIGPPPFRFDPFRFGDSPVYGFLDLDIDDNNNSGGELSVPAEFRYLAIVARFGRVPQGLIGGRAARSAQDIDQDFFTAPFYERTGADFAFALCGCWEVEIVFEGGNGDGIFDPGETWLVSGRFLERARGYVGASGAFGGSAAGHYDPLTVVRFQHMLATDTTIITLVEPLDMIGAAILTGEPLQPPNFSLLDHTSVLEALTDIIFGAGGPLSGPVLELTRLWRGRNAGDFMDVDGWEVTALFGTSYTSINASLYAWTDTGFDETPGDVNADALADDADIAMIRDQVYARDGGPTDADGIKNGRVVLINFGTNFSLFDIDGDGVIEGEDLWLYGHRADLDRNGVLDIFDFLQFQNLMARQDPRADFNLDERFDLFDFLAFQDAFVRR